MAFERLDSIVSRVVGRLVNEVGEDGVGAPSDAVNVAKSRKSADPEGPASYRVEQRHGGGEGHDGASRERMNAALPIGRKQRIAPGSPIPVAAGPMPAVRCFLVIEGGGGPARTQGGVRPGRLRAITGGGSREREFLKLVVGGGGH